MVLRPGYEPYFYLLYDARATEQLTLVMLEGDQTLSLF